MPRTIYLGTLKDYQVQPGAAGGVLLVSQTLGTTPIANFDEVHFEADERDYRVQDGKLIAEDAPLGGVSAGSFDRAGAITALANVKASLQAQIVQIDALAAKLLNA